MLETIERPLAGQSLAVRPPSTGLSLPANTVNVGSFAQLVVIVQNLVAQHQAENPLPYQRLEAVLDIAMGSKPRHPFTRYGPRPAFSWGHLPRGDGAPSPLGMHEGLSSARR